MRVKEDWRLAPIHFHRADVTAPERLATYHGTVAGLSRWLRNVSRIPAVIKAEPRQARA